MDTPFEVNQIGADSLRQRQEERLIQWAESVFAEPIADGNSINPRFYEQGFISREQEVILYKDLYSRDTELGLGLVDWRKSDLLDSIAYLKSSIKKREYNASLARSRQESLDKLATTNNLAQTQYAEPRAALNAELELLETELTFLRAYGSKIEALERVVKLIGSESSLRVTRSSEQILRVFSQSWRGLVKIKAWANLFSDDALLPSLQLYKQPGEPAGFILPLGESMRAVAVSRETAGYLLHMLKAINSLAEAYRNQLINGTFKLDVDWGYTHMLIRAIVELFYFCNFEMPFSYVDLAIDPEDPSQLCVYNYTNGTWEIVTEDSNSSRTLKRVGAEAAQILVNSVTLLKSRQENELSDIIRHEAVQITSPGESHNYRLFMCSGLSEFDLDPANQRVKFRMAFSSMAQLLDSIVEGQSDLTLVRGSVLGGPLQTILGMALVNSQAFSLPNGVRGLDPIGRFQILSYFWRVLGRRRAIAMLGEEYVKQVTNGLASLGEQGPEHPTFLTMRAGTVMNPSAARPGVSKVGKAPEEVEEEPPVSPFASLGLSDQIRLLDLTIQTWKMSEEFLEKLREVRSQGKLKRILETLPALVASRKEDVQMRFNTKWLVAKSWQWTFMRTCAPVAWDFWTKISSDEPWDNVLLGLPPYQALGQLLRLFSDIVRLVLVIELSGSEVAESIQIQAESAGQNIMAGLEGFFREGERLPPQVAEAVNFYYNPEIRFDSWLAFTSSFRRYLGQMKQDLKLLGVENALLSSITSLTQQIEILYPVRESEKAEEKVEEVQQEEALSDLFIDESNSEQVEFLLHNVLNVPEQDSWTFFKLLSLAIRADKRNLIFLVANNSEAVTSLLRNNIYVHLLFNAPSTAKTFFNYLNGLDPNNPPSPEDLEEMHPKMTDYFNQVSDLYSSLVPIANQIPNFLPQDRKKLSDYLASAPQKSNGLNFLILLACNRLVIDISDTSDSAKLQAERAESKIRTYLREQVNAKVEEPSIEIYPIGGGRILARKGQCIITHQDEGFEPLWCELAQPSSKNLYTRFIAKKFSMVVQLLGQEFPEYQMLVR
jgi:hypothetical protein